MRYTVKQYAESLFKALDGKSIEDRKIVIKRFIDLISKQKSGKNLQKILVQYEKVYLKNNNLKKIDIESVSDIQDKVLEDIEESIGNKVLVTKKINKDLISGLTITIDDLVFIDASGRKAINNLFSK